MISFLQRRLSVIANPAPQVSENDLLEMPGLKPLRPRLLSDALASCQQLLAAATGDEALSEEIDRSHFRVAPILEGLGDKTAALDEYQAALSFGHPSSGGRHGLPELRFHQLARRVSDDKPATRATAETSIVMFVLALGGDRRLCRP